MIKKNYLNLIEWRNKYNFNLQKGVVTRRPLELRLVYATDGGVPWGVFDAIPGKKFTDFGLIKSTISQLTDQVAGIRKGIVDNPIILTIYSSSCPDLSLVDLPGITRIPLAGSDQDNDIEKVTKSMAEKYKIFYFIQYYFLYKFLNSFNFFL